MTSCPSCRLGWGSHSLFFEAGVRLRIFKSICSRRIWLSGPVKVPPRTKEPTAVFFVQGNINNEDQLCKKCQKELGLEISWIYRGEEHNGLEFRLLQFEVFNVVSSSKFKTVVFATFNKYSS
ncbi:hypothetical protein AVEN_99571-1 [Araneus ventricosus]|uniref:Uncharacterized protein n=1 Tax=Araneus ventricosus TaxID=182803 RepID=A0A4Y2IBT1_ARAVE|nr:hypothetical protein AVEN_99571-1 [Araneus ventricosus]